MISHKENSHHDRSHISDDDCNDCANFEFLMNQLHPLKRAELSHIFPVFKIFMS